ncbi:hypothetical protein BDP55DRAFT_717097 [Colletotrichum godetiae]|uniref:Uncharacterized protein n=1 Tax=Colletotrichum godetiae TaxID=1209918 RepID=A0AAJ0ER49_9PEZI|nr:uncharacterized protein BDP55DRAFT_717097 [Colletotrichum godetiae]KAK1673551.1 hypothetical protein BDP55DRAFT_717097 [Colletotrichum godetiae]
MGSKNRTASGIHDDLGPQPCKKKARLHSPDNTWQCDPHSSNENKSLANADERTLHRQTKGSKQGHKRDGSKPREDRDQLKLPKLVSLKPDNEDLLSITDEAAYDADDESEIKHITAHSYRQTKRPQRMTCDRCRLAETDLNHQAPSRQTLDSIMDWDPFLEPLPTIQEESRFSGYLVKDDRVWSNYADISHGFRSN